MKTFAAVSALFLAAVSAAPVDPRTVTEYDISGFSANTTPHGTGAHVSYTIDIPGVLTTNCSYNDQTSISTLPSIPFTACDNPAVKWEFHQEAGQSPGSNLPYLLVITYTDAATGITVGGSKEWVATDFPVEQDDLAFSQRFEGAPDFVIANVS